MGLFCALTHLMKRNGPSFAKRDFVTDDARLWAFENMALLPTGVAGLTGVTPNNNYFYALPPTDFEFAVTPAQLPTGAPVGQPNPLITPALALSFIQNNMGR